MSETIIITGKDKILKVRILALRSMLRLEVKGLGRRGKSAYSIIKSEFGYKGNKEKVLKQIGEYIDQNILTD